MQAFEGFTDVCRKVDLNYHVVAVRKHVYSLQ